MKDRIDGKRIRKLREGRNLLQHDLASALRRKGFGTTQTTVSRWEKNQSPNASVLPALAAELGVDVSELYGDDGASVASDDDESSAMVATLLQQAVDAAVRQAMRRAGVVTA